MTKFLTLLCGVMLSALLASGANFTQCPAVGADTNGCELLISVSAVDGTGAATAFTVALSSPDQGPLDGSDVTLIGIVNNASSILNSITLVGNTDIFAFDGFGACAGFSTFPLYTPAPTLSQCGVAAYSEPTPDPDGIDYASAGVTFTGINGTFTTGTVHFSPGLAANGGTSWFSLEEALSPSSFTNASSTGSATPEPASAFLIGAGLVVLGLARRGRSKR